MDEQVTVRFPSLTLDGTNTWNIVGGVTTRRTVCAGATDGCQNFVMLAVIGDGRIMLRAANESPGSEVVVAPDFDPGLTYAPGASYRLRVRQLGASPSTIQAKAWKVGTPEPAGWLLERTGSQFSGPLSEGSGAVGLKTVSKLPGTNEVRFDDFSVDEFMPQTSYRPACDATSGCPTTAPTQTLNWDATNQDEGLHQVLMWTTDAVQRLTVKPWDIYLDRTAPAGLERQPDGLGQPQSLGPRGQLRPPHDGHGHGRLGHQGRASPGQWRRGGQRARVPDLGDDCPPSMTRDFTFNTVGRANNFAHRIQVIARDKVDNATTVADFTLEPDSVDPSQGTFGGDLWQPTGGWPSTGAGRKWTSGGNRHRQSRPVG